MLLLYQVVVKSREISPLPSGLKLPGELVITQFPTRICKFGSLWLNLPHFATCRDTRIVLFIELKDFCSTEQLHRIDVAFQWAVATFHDRSRS